jgi:hypothetical protein
MLSPAGVIQDVMQVCRNGHVITDLLRTHPDGGRTHCDRCGAATVERCPTCGGELPGALNTPLRPVGSRRPPLYCASCGAAFPWTERTDPAPGGDPLVKLECLLRRLPEVIRQLRYRHGDRPPFRVNDNRDLEDLVRALLPIQFDDVRPECRTPRYATATQTDFLLAPQGIALAVKYRGVAPEGAELARQLAEDVDYYQRLGYRTLVCFVYDPEGSLRHFTPPEVAGAAPDGAVDLCWVVGTP